MPPMTPPADRNLDVDVPLLRATLRFNTIIFCVIFGLLAGIALFALGLSAKGGALGSAPLIVALLGVFLPGYGPGWPGALAGLFWGGLIGAALAAAIYRINCRVVLGKVNDLVAMEEGGGDFPMAVLRLHGPSLGLAIGTAGALGLVVTTNWLVLRGTAAESIHARLLAHFLPGYAVTFQGSVIGAVELFALLFVFCVALAHIYNRIVAARHRHG
jgi:hypothetical protein